MPSLLGRLGVLGIALSLAACTDGRREQAPPPTPIVYEIANTDGNVEGWMLGTIHALPDGTEWRTPAIEEILAKADALLVEVPELDDQAEINATFTKLAVTPGLGPLSARVSPDLRKPLHEMIELSEIPRKRLESTEDWAAAILLSRIATPGKARNGVDREVIAEFGKRKVLGFETASEQLGIFDTLAPQDQRDLLEGTVREWMSSRDDPGRLTKAWLAGDAAVIEHATVSGIMADTELRDALLIERNKRWMPKLTSSLESEDRPLIAVGVAHLVGPNSLARLVEEAGYQVSRIEQ